MPNPRIQHVPALDGLRALAVLAVLFFHDNRLPGGFLGVDLFFVLSGFLITSLLVAEWETSGRIDLKRFWTRRATRLFPASFLMLVLVTVVLALTGEVGQFRGQIAASFLQVANWHAILSQHDYWDLFKSPSPFEHMWSLAIEEQFYLAWPLIVWGVLKAGKRRAWLAVVCVALGAISCWRFEVVQAASHSRAYFGTDTRAQALLAGAIVACWKTSPFSSRPVANVIAVLGLVAFLGASWALTGESAALYIGGFTLFAVVMAAFVGALASGPTWLSRPLSWPPLPALGKVSYGVYLWHWPVFCWLSTAHVKTSHLPAVTLLRFACTLGAALSSYWLLEQPLRTRRAPRHAHRYLVVVTLLFGCFPSIKAVSAARIRSKPAPSPPPPPVVADAGPPPSPFRVMLLGDSTANSLGWGIRGLQKPGVVVDLKGQDGCTMLADTCNGEQWTHYADELKPDAVIVFFGGAFLHGITADGQFRKACHKKWDSDFEATVERRLKDIASVDVHAWAATVPYPLGPYDNATIRREVDCINASIRRASGAVPRMRVLDLAERLCPKGRCERDFEDTPIRPDGVHFDIVAAADLSRWVVGELQR